MRIGLPGTVVKTPTTVNNAVMVGAGRPDSILDPGDLNLAIAG